MMVSHFDVMSRPWIWIEQQACCQKNGELLAVLEGVDQGGVLPDASGIDDDVLESAGLEIPHCIDCRVSGTTVAAYGSLLKLKFALTGIAYNPAAFLPNAGV
ncbi:hypothetical protein CO614_08535 [Lysobacteraceae bacterium NML120232]|nr:hypothetical protein CO614_08535 [Xanthomonadaceae bacterium NML120232]